MIAGSTGARGTVGASSTGSDAVAGSAGGLTSSACGLANSTAGIASAFSVGVSVSDSDGALSVAATVGSTAGSASGNPTSANDRAAVGAEAGVGTYSGRGFILLICVSTYRGIY